MVNVLEQTFPGLAKGDYRISSPQAKRYNCIAWATGDSGKWWWPGQNVEEEYWPPTLARVETLDAFRQAFASLGFVACQGTELELGFEKIAFLANNNGEPTHAARQLPSGRWTSKLGFLEDIEHVLHDLEGTEYGAVVLVMKRLLAAAAPSG
jgi:hypothetical protein